MGKNAGIRLGSCNNEADKSSHKKEVSELWERLINNKFYIGTQIVFGDSHNLIREALNCYSTCAYMATTIMCRSALEDAVHKFVTLEDPKWRKDPDGERIYTYTPSPCCRYLINYGEAKERLKEYYPQIFKHVSASLQKVREDGNFSAHYPSFCDKKYLRRIKKGSWIDQINAKRDLDSTLTVLDTLMTALGVSKEV